ncbi:hypothetical protein SAMN04515656_103114 [Eubacterium aggregans]|uniref:Glycosyl transferase family 1 domain-containing protein n=1 Tax=Eubacterium aggregans TaxID=81409 RepID=A0A1H3Y8S8_9FIRM|nr:glycosyltransferase family 4 protein [Eubacterium aggregans]SEA08006.1 hypothetical protein SAMN04515656_103114 [Eubacterium aggregans]
MKVLVMGSSKFPVPAVKGGAVPNLIEELIQQQEIENKIDLYCCSLWDKEAETESQKYIHTKFFWARIPQYIHCIDQAVIAILKKIFRMERLLSIGFLFQIIWFSFYTAKLLKKENFDKVVFENSVPLLFALKLNGNKRKYQDKYYIHMHSIPRRYYGNARVFSECKRLISISEYVANEIVADRRVIIRPEQVKVMYNCIDIGLMKPGTKDENYKLREKYSLAQDEKVILFVGRLCKEKGIEEVIKSVIEIENQQIKLIIVGTNFYNSGIVSPYEEYLQKLAQPIKKQIIFTGYVDYSKMPYLYNIADVVVLPSMWEEPAGMTIIEAMACCKPVITTLSGGIPEYTGENNCIVLEKDNTLILKIKSSIINVLNDPFYANELANRGHDRARRYNKAFYYEQFLKILVES